jgi:hypothetical protein
MNHTFHLAYFRHNVDVFRTSPSPTSQALAYALIPSHLFSFVEHQRFKTVSDSGRPGADVLASHYELLSLRRPDIPVDQRDVVESHLIQVLVQRAMAAGHVLPPIVPTLKTPAWSKMVLPRDLLGDLRRIGGL